MDILRAMPSTTASYGRLGEDSTFLDVTMMDDDFQAGRTADDKLTETTEALLQAHAQQSHLLNDCKHALNAIHTLLQDDLD